MIVRKLLLLIVVLALIALGVWYVMHWPTFRTVAIVDHKLYRTEIERPTDIATGDDLGLRIHVYKGEEVPTLRDDFRMLHVMIASADGRDLFHTYSTPEVKTGVFEQRHFFTRPGIYRVWTEIGDYRDPNHHGTGADLISYDEFTVSGAPIWNFNESTEGQRSSSGAYTLLVEPKELTSGKPITLRISVMNPDGKRFSLYPLEGADYSLTGPEHDFFSHGHLQTTKDGMFVELPITFPRPGTYGLWVEAFPFIDNNFGSLIFRLMLPVK